jgi:hypothetical protein
LTGGKIRICLITILMGDTTILKRNFGIRKKPKNVIHSSITIFIVVYYNRIKIILKMNEKIPYLRVGTTYYKTIEKPLISGDKISFCFDGIEKPLSATVEKISFKIPKYDGFCVYSNI